jgi:hypothetical protein
LPRAAGPHGTTTVRKLLLSGIAAHLLLFRGEPAPARRSGGSGSASGIASGPGRLLLGAVSPGLAYYLSVTFLTRWFETRTVTPFALYRLIIGVLRIIRSA